MRLFLAVTIPDALKREVYAAAEPLRQAAPAVRWTPFEQLHITLKFLGEVLVDGIPPIESGLIRAAGGLSSFELEFSEIGAFPNLHRPRVYWLGVTEPSALRQLQQLVETTIAPLGFPREARPFHPHLTLGRVGTEVPAGQLRTAERQATDIDYHGRMVVSSAELMLSRLSPRGARYEVLRSATLNGGN